MRWRRYPALAAALLLFAAAVLVGSYHVIREYQLITGKFVPNLWVAAQAELEYLRFVNQLERHAFDDVQEEQELATRLYILASRLPLLLQGSESEHVRAVEGAPETIRRLSDTLGRLEPDILALRRGDAATYRTIHAALAPFEVPLHRLVAGTLLEDEEVAAAQRAGVREVYWQVLGCIAGTTVSAAVLVFLLFRAFRSVSRSLGAARAAEAAEAAARAQLKAVIDAVPARIGARDRDGRPVFHNRYEAEWRLACAGDGPPAGGALDPPPRRGGGDRGAGAPLPRDPPGRGRGVEPGEPVPLFQETRPGGAAEGRTWLTTKVPLRDVAGAVAHVVTVALDVTEQKEAQGRTALLATAVEHAGDAIEITDAEARF